MDDTGAKRAIVMKVIENYPQQIRWQMKDPISVKGALVLEIPQIAKEYGGRVEIPTNVLKECVRLVINKFQHLAINEIREAYRQYAAGELKIKGAEMYGGEFNAMQLGKILTAYKENRKPVLAKVLATATEMRDEERRKERKEKAIESFEKTFPESLVKANQLYFKRLGEIKEPELKEVFINTQWQQVPEFWYWSAKSRNYFEVSKEEGAKIFEEAMVLAKIELERRMEDRRIKRAVFVEIDLETIAKSIARKICVHRKIISNPNFKI